MAKQIYIDENGNEQLVSGTINNAELLPISSNDPTNTKDYIDGRTPINNGGHATDLSTTGLSTGTYLYTYDNTTNGTPTANTEGNCFIFINNTQSWGSELAISNSGLFWRNKQNQVWGAWNNITADSGWQNFTIDPTVATIGTGRYARYRKIGRIVYFEISLTLVNSISTFALGLCKFPSGYRPGQEQDFAGRFGANVLAMYYLTTSGDFAIVPLASTTNKDNLYCQGSFIAEN